MAPSTYSAPLPILGWADLRTAYYPLLCEETGQGASLHRRSGILGTQERLLTSNLCSNSGLRNNLRAVQNLMYTT